MLSPFRPGICFIVAIMPSAARCGPPTLPSPFSPAGVARSSAHIVHIESLLHTERDLRKTWLLKWRRFAADTVMRISYSAILFLPRRGSELSQLRKGDYTKTLGAQSSAH